MCIRSSHFLYDRIPPSGWSRKNLHKGFCEGYLCVPTAVSSVCTHSLTLLGFRLVSEENWVWVQLWQFCNRLLKKKERGWENRKVEFPGDFQGMFSMLCPSKGKSRQNLVGKGAPHERSHPQLKCIVQPFIKSAPSTAAATMALQYSNAPITCASTQVSHFTLLVYWETCYPSAGLPTFHWGRFVSH